MEGRIFLLGRNGFYNKICEEKKLKNTIFFLLLFKDISPDFTEDEGMKIIHTLINKGDQKDLELYLKDNKIICINDDDLENDLKNKSERFYDICCRAYIHYSLNNQIIGKGNITLLHNNDNDNDNDNEQRLTPKEELIINKIIKNPPEQRNSLLKNKFKCFIL
jgi:hypothetical protein